MVLDEENNKEAEDEDEDNDDETKTTNTMEMMKTMLFVVVPCVHKATCCGLRS